MIYYRPLSAFGFMPGGEFYLPFLLEDVFHVRARFAPRFPKGREDREAVCFVVDLAGRLAFLELFLPPRFDFVEHGFLVVVFVADAFEKADDLWAKLRARGANASTTHEEPEGGAEKRGVVSTNDCCFVR